MKRNILLAVGTLFVFCCTLFMTSASYAHRPDRCFHSHFGGGTQCKSGVPGKRCTDANGNRGKCEQGGSFCYCKLFRKSNDNEEDRVTAEDVIEFGIGIGEAINEGKRHRKHKKKRRHKRDDDDDWYYERD